MAAVKKFIDLVFIGRERRPIHLHFDGLEYAAPRRETDQIHLYPPGSAAAGWLSGQACLLV
jgi:hypothetical protein